MSLFNLLDFQASGREYMEAGIRHQHQTADFHLLNEVGPGHMIVRSTWKTIEGMERSVAAAFPVKATSEEIDAWKRAQGWPGHDGSKWNRFKGRLRSSIAQVFSTSEQPNTNESAHD